MTVNAATLSLIESFEGCRLTAYQDSVHVWTIGYGHTRGVKPGQTITQQQAEQFLRDDLSLAEADVRALAKRFNLTLNENQFGALVSFTFNLGAGNLRKLLSHGMEAIPQRILLFDHAGGKALAGLTRRRQAEAKLFNTPVQT